MKNLFISRCIGLLVVGCAWINAGLTAASVESPDAVAAADESAQHIVLDPETGRLRIGSVELDPVARRLRFPAQVNMQEGLLEYALVTGGGKLHESLLRTDVDPMDIQVALTLLGLKGRADKTREPSPIRLEGEGVRIDVEWREGEGEVAVPVRKRLERMITDQRSGESMSDQHWIFTGSRIVDGVLMVRQEGSIVAIYRDSLAMMENPLPEAVDDTLWYARQTEVPVPGTSVLVEISVPQQVKSTISAF